MSKIFVISKYDYFWKNSQSLKYSMFTPSGWKDVGLRKLEFEAVLVPLKVKLIINRLFNIFLFFREQTLDNVEIEEAVLYLRKQTFFKNMEYESYF